MTRYVIKLPEDGSTVVELPGPDRIETITDELLNALVRVHVEQANATRELVALLRSARPQSSTEAPGTLKGVELGITAMEDVERRLNDLESGYGRPGTPSAVELQKGLANSLERLNDLENGRNKVDVPAIVWLRQQVAQIVERLESLEMDVIEVKADTGRYDEPSQADEDAGEIQRLQSGK